MARQDSTGQTPRSALSPFSRTGSIINVVLCSMLTAIMFIVAVGGEPAAFIGATIGIILLVVFVVVAVAESTNTDRADVDEYPARNGVIHNYPSARGGEAKGELAMAKLRSRRRGGSVVIHNYPSAPPDKL